MKRLLLTGIAVLLVAALLIGAWFLDPSRKTRREEKGTFSYQIPKESRVELDVLITCSEEVMNGAPEAFAKNLGLQGVPIKLPGGPLLLAQLLTGEVNEELRPLQRSVTEVLKRYGPRKIVVVSHSECLFYDTLAAWRNDLEKIRQRQDADLRAAKAALQTWLPKAEITCYFAEREGDKLVFREAEACKTKEEGR